MAARRTGGSPQQKAAQDPQTETVEPTDEADVVAEPETPDANDVTDADPVAAPAVGAAVPDGASPTGTLLPGAGENTAGVAPSQADDAPVDEQVPDGVSPTGTLLPGSLENTVGAAPSQATTAQSASPDAQRSPDLDEWAAEGVEFVTPHSSLIVYCTPPVYFQNGRATVTDTDQLHAICDQAEEFDIKVAVPVRYILNGLADDEGDLDDDESGASTGA